MASASLIKKAFAVLSLGWLACFASPVWADPIGDAAIQCGIDAFPEDLRQTFQEAVVKGSPQVAPSEDQMDRLRFAVSTCGQEYDVPAEKLSSLGEYSMAFAMREVVAEMLQKDGIDNADVLAAIDRALDARPDPLARLNKEERINITKATLRRMAEAGVDVKGFPRWALYRLDGFVEIRNRERITRLKLES